MQRRELLKTACFAAGVGLPGETASREPMNIEALRTPSRRPEKTQTGETPWFLDWVPPSLARGKVSYSLGAAPAGQHRDRVDTPEVHLITDRVMLHASITADLHKVRERLAENGYEALSGQQRETYARSAGTRHRVIEIADEAVIRGVGPAPGLVRDRVRSFAETNGSDGFSDRLAQVFPHLLPADVVSLDVRPTPEVGIIGEHIFSNGDRSHLRTVVIPTPGIEDYRLKEYLSPMSGVDGVISSSTTRRGRAFIRDATVSKADLVDRMEGHDGF